MFLISLSTWSTNNVILATTLSLHYLDHVGGKLLDSDLDDHLSLCLVPVVSDLGYGHGLTLTSRDGLGSCRRSCLQLLLDLFDSFSVSAGLGIVRLVGRLHM